MRPTSYATGLWSELLAILYLFCKGYRVRAWRYKTKMGEIDIVASKGRILALVEVKARAGMDDALQAVSSRMRQRIGMAARYYIGRHSGFAGYDIRYDLIAVSGLRIQHLDNAWPHSA